MRQSLFYKVIILSMAETFQQKSFGILAYLSSSSHHVKGMEAAFILFEFNFYALCPEALNKVHRFIVKGSMVPT